MSATSEAASRPAGIEYTIVDSPVGQLLVGATLRGLAAVRLGESDAQLEAELQHDYPGAERRLDGAPLACWVNVLLRHLDGAPLELSAALDVPATAFQHRVWQALRAIPYGATRSYGEIARGAGRSEAARAVARACAANPVALVTPCHRVIRGDGAPGGYRWGARRKRLLLERERAAVQAEPPGLMQAELAGLDERPRPARADAAPRGNG